MFTKILYSATYVGATWYGPGGPWYLLLVPMLWVIYSMQVHNENIHINQTHAFLY